VRSRPGRWHSGHATDGPRADLIVASAHSDADVVASAKDYVDEVEAMFERVSTVNVAEMTATIEQGLSNLEAVIASIPPAVERRAGRDRTGRDDEGGYRTGAVRWAWCQRRVDAPAYCCGRQQP
jgi:hypothetical protein